MSRDELKKLIDLGYELEFNYREPLIRMLSHYSFCKKAELLEIQ